MKIFKKIIAGLLGLFLLLAVIFFAGRYGWKVMGFRACQGAGIESVTVGENTVEIKGFYPGSFPEGFCGYYAEEQDGTLYVGFRFSAVFGFFETGDFDVTIPVRSEIQEVILKTKAMETSIWTAESGPVSENEKYGVYVKLERSDTDSAFLRYNGLSKVWQNADGSLPESGEWLFTGEEIAQLSRDENRSVLFTVGAQAADGTLLAENAFLYDIAQERLYVTVSEDGVTCSTSDAVDAPSDVPSVLTLPILDEINETVTVGTSGSSLLAIQAAVKLLDWGTNTGLGTEEIEDATSTWLSQQGDDLNDCLHKLSLVDEAYQLLLGGNARELLDTAGCAGTEITWGSEAVEPVEAIMGAAGLR